VLHIFNELKFSGAEWLLYSAASMFCTTGTHAVLSTGEEVGDFAPMLQEQGYLIEHLPFRKTPFFFNSLRSIVRRGRFDLVHVHAERAAIWNELTALLSGAACVRTIHSEFRFSGRLRAVRGTERRIAATLGVRHVACSENVAKNEFLRFRLRTTTIENWIDPRRIQRGSLDMRGEARRRLGLPENAFIVVSVGNYGPMKNQEAIVDAVGICADKLPIYYIHCGAGGESLARKVPLGVRDRIQFMGPRNDVGDILAASDAFLSPSFFEGGPIALLEAAAAGIPCVTTNVGLAAVLEGRPGVTLIEANGESLARAILQVAAIDLPTRLANGEELSEFVLGRFVPSVGASRYLALYEETMRQSGPGKGNNRSGMAAV
jgi:glycosyltransferase involved in cell wall biosynthesis